MLFSTLLKKLFAQKQNIYDYLYLVILYLLVSLFEKYSKHVKIPSYVNKQIFTWPINPNVCMPFIA